MRAIVTGGAGFIGSHLCRRLLKEGWSVLAVDNLSSGRARNLPPGCEFKWLDLADEDARTVLPKNGVDVVFHLASHVGQELSFERPLFDLKANAFSTMILLEGWWSYDRGAAGNNPTLKLTAVRLLGRIRYRLCRIVSTKLAQAIVSPRCSCRP